MDLHEIAKTIIEHIEKKPHVIDREIRIDKMDDIDIIEIEAVNGDVKISFSDEVSEAIVNAHVSVYESNEEALEGIKYDLNRETLHIYYEESKIDGISFEIKLPVKDYGKLKIVTKNCDILISNGRATHIGAETKNGKIELKKGQSVAIMARTKNGKIVVDEMDFSDNISNTLICQTANADIIVAGLKHANGKINIWGEAKNYHGLVDISGLGEGKCKETHFGQFLENSSNLEIILETKNGNIILQRDKVKK